MSTVFRPAQVVEAVSESKPLENQTTSEYREGKTTVQPTLYSQETGKPYSAKVFAVEKIFADLDSDTALNLATVDEYFRNEVHSNHLDNSDSGYQELIKKLERVTESKSMPMRSKLGRMAEFIKYSLRIKKYEQ